MRLVTVTSTKWLELVKRMQKKDINVLRLVACQCGSLLNECKIVEITVIITPNRRSEQHDDLLESD